MSAINSESSHAWNVYKDLLVLDDASYEVIITKDGQTSKAKCDTVKKIAEQLNRPESNFPRKGSSLHGRVSLDDENAYVGLFKTGKSLSKWNKHPWKRQGAELIHNGKNYLVKAGSKEVRNEVILDKIAKLLSALSTTPKALYVEHGFIKQTYTITVKDENSDNNSTQ